MENRSNIYLEFCKRILTDTISDEVLRRKFFAERNMISETEMIKSLGEDVDDHSLVGDFWPRRADTMMGMKRLDNLQFCIDQVIKENIDGDFIETGVWRGGGTIFMKIMLNHLGIKNKIVYVADSFEGLPSPDVNKYPKDAGSMLHTQEILRVSLEEVKENFKRYNVLDDNVKFLKGWFSTTMKNSSIDKLSILRLDGDLYSSTWEVLENLYDKVSKGGFIIIDDYYLPTCRDAVNDFRKMKNIDEPLIPVDWTGVFWRKGNNDIKNLSSSRAGEEAFDVLLRKYHERTDLQSAFPEVSQGVYQNLINWAVGVVQKKWEDPSYDTLILFRNWYLNYETPAISVEKQIEKILPYTNFSGLYTPKKFVENDIHQHLQTLLLIIIEHNLQQVLELGVRDGVSTVTLVEAISKINGHVWSVDLDDAKMARQKISSMNLDQYWTFIQNDSILAAERWKKSVDLILVDTAHYYEQTLKELQVYEKFLNVGGFILLHDTKSFPGVLNAVEDFLKSSKSKYNFYNYINNNGLGILRKTD